MTDGTDIVSSLVHEHLPSTLPLSQTSLVFKSVEDEQCFYSIEKIHFSLFSSREIKQLSVSSINSSRLSGPGTVYDPRLGVIENNISCITCGLDNHSCPGHFGHIELCVPVLHPMYYSEIQSYLNCFCDSCFSLLLTPDQMNLLGLLVHKGFDRFNKVCEYIKTKVKTCPSCKQEHSMFHIKDGKVKKYIGEKMTRENSVDVPAEDIETLFTAIPQEIITLLGFSNPQLHPLHLLLRNFPVLPLSSRPFVETGKGTCDDDLTTKYIEIVKNNNKLKKENRKEERDRLISTLEFHISTLMNNSKKKARQSNNRPIKCLKERLNGKQGRFRGNLSGKRVDFSARTVIGPEPCCRVDEIVIPEEFATRVTFPERCCSYNKLALQSLVDTGKANSVIRNGTVKNIKVHNQIRAFLRDSSFTFQPGDMVVRELFTPKNGQMIKTQKKIDPFRFFQATGRELELGVSDMVVRNGKLLRNIRTQQRFFLQAGDQVKRH